MTGTVKGGLIRLIGALVLLIMMYPMFGYLILPAGLLLLGVNAVFRKILKKLHKQVQETDGNLRIFPQYYGMLASAERIREIEECFLQDLLHKLHLYFTINRALYSFSTDNKFTLSWYFDAFANC